MVAKRTGIIFLCLALLSIASGAITLVDGNSESLDLSKFAIVSVTAQSAQVLVKKELKVGDKLTTKYDRRVQPFLTPVW